MKIDRKYPKYPLPWLCGILILTITIGVWSLRFHQMMAGKIRGQQVQVVAVAAVDTANGNGKTDYARVNPSPLSGNEQKELPEMQDWNEKNLGLLSDNNSELDRINALLGANVRSGSYKSQIRYLASLQENARIYAKTDSKTGLAIAAQEAGLPKPSATMGCCYVLLMEESWTEEQAMMVTVIDRGQGLTLERMDGDGIIPVTAKEGYSFAGWWHEGKELSATYVEANALYAAKYVDDIAPTMTVSSSVNGKGNAVINVTATDLGNGIAEVYIGKENTQYDGAKSVNYQQEITEPGTYHIVVKDTDNNVVSQEFHVYQFQIVKDEKTEAAESFLVPDLEEVTLPQASKPGYAFSGWKKDGEDAVFLSICPTEDMVIMPVFAARTYTITLDATPGSVEAPSVEAAYDAAVGSLPVPTREGYVFEGWYTGADGSGEEYTEDTILRNFGITLYAKWTPARYTIIFDRNGGISGEMNSMEAEYDQTYALARNAFARPGYVFMGWSLSPDTVSTQNSITARDRSYNGAEWLNEDSVSNLTTENGAQVTLYAIWQEIGLGVMDYRYCLGSYKYFACVTTNYATENSSDEGALFVAMSPTGNSRFGDSANWSSSTIRANMNDLNQVDVTGLKTCNTTVNKSYSGLYYNYDPYMQSPCLRDDMGFAGRLTASAVSAGQTEDYFFVPDMSDFYRYYTGTSWNWFWDINLDGTVDTIPITGVNAYGYTDAYMDCIRRSSATWAGLGWDGRYWLRNSYTGYSNYPYYICAYGVGVCNPTNDDFAMYRNYCQYGLLIRAMYTMPMN